MKCIVLEAPGKFVAAERPAPAAPAAGEALVNIHRVGVCGTDLHAFRGKQPFFSYPRVLGHELGVEVVAVGAGVLNVAAGDRCAVEPYLNCQQCIACRAGKTNCCTQMKVLGVHIDGGHCETMIVPARKLHRSSTLSMEQLALVETLAIGAHAVDRAAVRKDEWTLIIGAGPIGLSVLQFAQVAGARVVMMDISARRLTFCRDRMGVSHTIDTNTGDPVEALRLLTGGDMATAVFDATGNPQSMMAALKFVAHGGRLVYVGLFQGDFTLNDPEFHRRETALLSSRNALAADFTRIISLIEAGQVDTRPWVTHRAALAEIPRIFETWLAPDACVLKAVIEINDTN